MNKITAVFLIIGCFFALLICVGALRQVFFSIDSTGELSTLNIHADTSKLNWGIIDIGDNKTMPFNIFNDGNVPLQLSLVDDAPSFISTGWNREGYVLDSGESIAASIWLLASDTSELSFSFSYTIIGTET